MGAPKITFIPALIEEHLEELAFLWMQRQGALRSSDYTLRAFLELEERLEAHVQGILVAGEAAGPMLLERIAAEETSACFAAAYAMLRLDRPPLGETVVQELLSSEADRRAGLTMALSHGATQRELPKLRGALAASNPGVQLAIAEVLCFHSPADLRLVPLGTLLRHEDVGIRAQAWRVTYLHGTVPTTEDGLAGIVDEDNEVRMRALAAVAWAGQPWLLDHCRRAALKASLDDGEEMRLLGVLGKPDDLSLVLALGRKTALGPGRFDVFGNFGHPAIMPDLLTSLRDSNPLVAAAAAASFTKITGLDIASAKRAVLPPSDGSQSDAFEKEFLPEVALPDSDRAHAFWEKEQARFRTGTRWARGVDISQPANHTAIPQLDMESRWQTVLRSSHAGTLRGSPSDWERFPHKRSAQVDS